MQHQHETTDHRNLSPAARQIRKEIDTDGVVHGQRYQDKRYRPILKELEQRGAILSVGKGYLATNESVERLAGRVAASLPADSRTVSHDLGLSHGSARALLGHLVESERLSRVDGVYHTVTA